MAICNTNETSDAYIFEAGNNEFVLHVGQESYELGADDAVAKVQELRAQGWRIPEHVEAGIRSRAADPLPEPAEMSDEEFQANAEKAAEIFKRFSSTGQRPTEAERKVLLDAGIMGF